jgi:hypothetical protein
VPREDERDPTERPTEGRRDLRQMNASPEDAQGGPRATDEERTFERGSGGAMADAAVEHHPDKSDHVHRAPHARRAEPVPEGEKHDQLAKKEEACEDRQEALLDEGVEETFPASDPVSVKRIT